MTLTARQLGDGSVGIARQMNEGEQFLDATGLLFLGKTANPERVSDIAANGQMRKQRQRLEHHAEVSLVGRLVGDVLTVDRDGAGGGQIEAGDHAEQRRLATA
ncbi:MAG: hypothetical protein H6R00_3916 [Proteobacteria bacterium]|nr:hypothetical protein [Pseudomonadota bacterium]